MDQVINNKEAKRLKILGMYFKGETPTEIARQLGISRTTVYHWLKRYAEEKKIVAHKVGGSSKRTTADEDARILAALAEDPFTNSTKIQRRLQLPVSARTIRRRLHEAGFHKDGVAGKEIRIDKQNAQSGNQATEARVKGVAECLMLDHDDRKDNSASSPTP